MNDRNIDRLQMDMDRLVQWAVQHAIKINPGSRKAVSFTRSLLKGLLNYFGGTKEFRKREDCKYLRTYSMEQSPHAPPISFFSILSPAQYWVRSTDH